MYYVYIASCHVVVKFYRDLYFRYILAASVVSGDWTDIDFFNFTVKKTTPETNKTVKVSATSVVK